MSEWDCLTVLSEVVNTFTTCCNVKELQILPQSVFMCFVKFTQ